LLHALSSADRVRASVAFGKHPEGGMFDAPAGGRLAGETRSGLLPSWPFQGGLDPAPVAK